MIDDTSVPISGPVSMGPSAGDTPVRTCPRCGEAVPADPRFVVWCAACGWNTDPQPPDAPKGRLEGRRHRLAVRHGEQLYGRMQDELTGKDAAGPRLDAAGVAAYVLAWAVHLVTGAIAVAGLLLIVLGLPAFPPVLLGCVLLLLVAALRPRLGRPPKHAVTVEREAAPELYALLDRVAAEAGTRGADLVVLDARGNAGVSEYGLRRRRLLRIGLPLWHILTPQQRVAVLGHEFGHYANGDTRRGLVVGTALNTLSVWYYVLRPGSARGRTLAQTVAAWLIAVPWLAAAGLLRLLDRLTLRASQRAEYRADAAAARIGSGAAAAAALDRMHLLDAVGHELRRQAILARTRNKGADPKVIEANLWQSLADHADGITEHEHERLRRVSALRGHSTDSTHPPTHLRTALLASAADLPAATALDAGRIAAIDAELAAPGRELAKRTLRDLHL